MYMCVLHLQPLPPLLVLLRQRLPLPLLPLLLLLRLLLLCRLVCCHLLPLCLVPRLVPLVIDDGRSGKDLGLITRGA